MSLDKGLDKDLDKSLAVLEYIKELRSSWKPRTKKVTGYRYHNDNGDKVEHILYFDNFKCEWTTEDSAFRGYVFLKISKLMRGF